eukprot:2752926-Prymnesium_polylepis.1
MGGHNLIWPVNWRQYSHALLFRLQMALAGSVAALSISLSLGASVEAWHEFCDELEYEPGKRFETWLEERNRLKQVRKERSFRCVLM